MRKSIIALFLLIAFAAPQANAAARKANIAVLKGTYTCSFVTFNFLEPNETTFNDLKLVVDRKGKIKGSGNIETKDNNCDPLDPEITCPIQVSRPFTFSGVFSTPKLKNSETTASYKGLIDKKTKARINARGASLVYGNTRSNSIRGTLSLGSSSGSPVESLYCSMPNVLK